MSPQENANRRPLTWMALNAQRTPGRRPFLCQLYLCYEKATEKSLKGKKTS